MVNQLKKSNVTNDFQNKTGKMILFPRSVEKFSKKQRDAMMMATKPKVDFIYNGTTRPQPGEIFSYYKKSYIFSKHYFLPVFW